MKTALGMIVRSLDSDAELMRFIENAEKYGHTLDCVIVAYGQHADPKVESKLKKKVRLFAVDINNPHYCLQQFRRLGISESAARTLLTCPAGMQGGMVPYGFNRNIVLIEAMLRGIDILFFTDSDVLPCTLEISPGGRPASKDIDFFGAHLEQLEAGSQVTTGEYSGYNILPPAMFDGMGDLLAGVQKAEMLEYWQNSNIHRCLTVLPPVRETKPCTKVLGGNCAIRLSSLYRLPPFFSSYFTAGGEIFLCRGEDTVLGRGIAKSGSVCTDIGLYPLHDTYKDYPAEPNLRGDLKAQDRFYYACTGWVGRNPFLNYLSGNDLSSTREYQQERLGIGLKALVEYTANPKFYEVAGNFQASWNSLERYISEYRQLLEAWEEFTSKCLNIEPIPEIATA